MNFLTTRKELELLFVPKQLTLDFEVMVLDTYFEGGWCDLYHLTDPVDVFAVYALSEEETGSPYTYINDLDWMEENSGDVVSNYFYDILNDVSEVLNFHHIFHAWNDKGDEKEYKFEGEVHNMPIKEVW